MCCRGAGAASSKFEVAKAHEARFDRASSRRLHPSSPTRRKRLACNYLIGVGETRDESARLKIIVFHQLTRNQAASVQPLDYEWRWLLQNLHSPTCSLCCLLIHGDDCMAGQALWHSPEAFPCGSAPIPIAPMVLSRIGFVMDINHIKCRIPLIL